MQPGALEIMLIAGSKTIGSRRSSSSAAVVCILAFSLMILWEMSRNPMIDLRMVATRQFGACFL